MIYAVALALALPFSHAVAETDFQSAASGTQLLRLATFGIQSLSHLESPLSPRVMALLDVGLGILAGVVLLGLFAAAGSILRRRHPERPALMGWGDVKFLAMLGAFFGADACLFITCVASILGWLYGSGKKLVLLQNATNDAKGRQANQALHQLWNQPVYVPFGPMLSIAAFVWMLMGSGYSLFVQ